MEIFQKSTGLWQKRLILLLVSVVGAMTLLVFEGTRFPDSTTAWSNVAASLTGSALLYYLIAMFFAGWVKGVPGVILGTATVALQCYFGSADAYHRHKDAEVIDDLKRYQRKMTETASAQFKALGYIHADPTEIQSTLDYLSRISKDVDPQTKSAIEAIIAVISALVAPMKEVWSIREEILTAAFRDPASIRTIADIDTRLARTQQLRMAAQQTLSILSDLGSRLKAELLRRNVPARQIKEWAEPFTENLHLEILIPLAQSTVDCTDFLIRRLTLLKSQFGRWYMKGNVIYFVDSSALQDWNDNLSQFLKSADNCQTLEHQWMATQQ